VDSRCRTDVSLLELPCTLSPLPNFKRNPCTSGIAPVSTIVTAQILTHSLHLPTFLTPGHGHPSFFGMYLKVASRVLLLSLPHQDLLENKTLFLSHTHSLLSMASSLSGGKTLCRIQQGISTIFSTAMKEDSAYHVTSANPTHNRSESKIGILDSG
jgi:hypothetical protein